MDNKEDIISVAKVLDQKPETFWWKGDQYIRSDVVRQTSKQLKEQSDAIAALCKVVARMVEDRIDG